MSETYNNILTKGLSSALDSTPVKNDTIRITTDTGEMYVDFEGKREKISDIIRGMTESEIRNLLAPLPKFYYASDTRKILYYDTDWRVLNEGGGGDVEFATRALQDNNGNQIDTTYATLESPALTGAPTTPNVTKGDNSTNIANTAFVKTAITDAVGERTSEDFDKLFNTVLTGKLLSGATTLSISDPAIKDNTVLSVYASKFGVNITDITTENGSATITFDPVDEDIIIKAVIESIS